MRHGGPLTGVCHDATSARPDRAGVAGLPTPTSAPSGPTPGDPVTSARTPRVTVSVLAAALTLPMLVLTGPSGTARAATAGAAPRPLTTHQSCAAPAPGAVRCLSVWRHAGARTATATATAKTTVAPAIALPASGYGPPDIVSAYQLDTTAGAGQTVGIVDAFDNPRVEADLAAYRAVFGLPACTTANGCFRKVNQNGGATPPAGDPGWGVEIALDVQAVSAACPRCRILLVEASDAGLTSIGTAVNAAVRLGATVVSNSYGTAESNGILTPGAQYYTHAGVAQVASSGDEGYAPANFPAVLATVIAAGGTSLVHHANGTWSETAWSGSGSGCSAIVAKPSWQHDARCARRTVADLSAVADPATGFAVYDTYGLGADNGWIVVGGTSLASPLIAGMIGLAGNARDLDSAGHIYTGSSGLADVVGGSNGSCGGSYLCTAVTGYDGPTGLGSPRGTGAL